MSSQDLLNLAAVSATPSPVIQVQKIRSYSKERAFSLAKMLTTKGLPSEPYPVPSGDGTYAIRAVEMN